MRRAEPALVAAQRVLEQLLRLLLSLVLIMVEIGGDDGGGAEHDTTADRTSSALPRLRTTSPSSLRVRTVLG